ncbi:hypothetical protein SNE40_013849 [Patella caerulea]|uniref:Protein phosphatase 1 regulatory subunit 35 C-terminal domain-containing protein n=2 Tax=Patella caerulea TaxID=87958 RepID=A0AAN8JK39_PATCE
MAKMADGLISSQSVYSRDISDFTKTHRFTDYTQPSTSFEFDTQPTKPPIPSWKEEILKSAIPDTNLNLTPDRATKKFVTPSDRAMSPTVSIISKPLTKPKLKQKVRFDIDDSVDNGSILEISAKSPVEYDKPSVNLMVNSPSKSTPMKEYCPKMYASKTEQSVVSDSDLDVTQTDDDTNSDGHSRPMSLEQSYTETALRFLTIKESEQIKPEPPRIVDSVPAHARKCHAVKHVIVTREYENRPDPTDYQFPFVDHTVTFEPEHVFARPEYNSTLKISEELKDLKSSKPKVAQTLKQKLKQSEETRTDINEKASVKVNCSKDLFAGLVGVEPDINNLCLEVEREATLKSRSKSHKTNKSSSKKQYGISGTKSEPKVPDILEFYSEDRQREIPDLHLTGISISDVKLTTADQSTAFDIYRHNKVWDTLNN